MQVARGYGDELHEVEWDDATERARRKKKSSQGLRTSKKRKKMAAMSMYTRGK